nr:ORF6N domain-containing protein [Candidatus Cloacimonadota bacterium]
MNDSHHITPIENILNRIYTMRGVQVMFDRDLAKLYQVETKVLNQAVKRNIERFPNDFMFQLTKDELDYWRSQIVTSNKDKMGLRRPPYAFTEQGVSMLSSILKSQTAINISINIIRAFVEMRKFISTNAGIFQRLSNLEQKQIVLDIKQIEADNKIDAILNAIEEREIKPKQDIFFEGQIFDAYKFVSDLFRSAQSSILIIDNYI